ncbi:DNA cytosine methyltransferase [Kribbella italica]|uniref:DNA (Cytosine-5)-methyltransferase 1 n=1 Tax=Kribbella italica TaxID=1540520 RepID=A0A7W9JDK3_9ACTN|nr:DNA (cytosine-5)-methyltransferase 1 [Kribbella italica]
MSAVCVDRPPASDFEQWEGEFLRGTGVMPLVSSRPDNGGGLELLDDFAGWGGSSAGASSVPGVELKMAANHNRLAVEVHAKNFPWADHFCGDIVRANIAGWPRADLFWASPACPAWSNARGVRRTFDQSLQGVMFDDQLGVLAEPEAVRSRALMEEVPRYLRAMADKGEPVLAGVVENVVECRKWDEWNRWLREIRETGTGYEVRVIALNSMHAQAPNSRRAPQSRDRLYVAYWLKALGRAPDWDKWLRPKAYCPTCDAEVYAMQVFKDHRLDMGKYGKTGQYWYRCPNVTCRYQVVEPYVAPAAAAIDFSLPMGKRIADRTAKGGKDKMLAPATLARIEKGLAKLRAAGEVRPFIAELRGGGSTTRGIDRPLATFSAKGTHHALVMPPGTEGVDWGHLLVPYYRTGVAHGLGQPMNTLTTKDRYALVHLAESLRVEDCKVRMLTPPEIATGMAFPLGYLTAGERSDQVQGFGNAVTPPAAEVIMSAIVEAITGQQLALAA